jgi:hypothetical protein
MKISSRENDRYGSLAGIDIACTDGEKLPPESIDLPLKDKQGIQDWFFTHPEGVAPAIRLLSYCAPCENKQDTAPTTPEFVFEPEVIKHAIWTEEAYVDLTSNRRGGCSALLDEPVCFILQTPLDNGPFCSLAMSRRGHAVKGIFTYRSADVNDKSGVTFDPIDIIEGERIQSGWRSNGMQIISLPHSIAKAQSRYITFALNEVVKAMQVIEVKLAARVAIPEDLAGLSRELQANGEAVIILERRARFTKQILTSIEDVTSSLSRHGGKPWPPLSPLKSQLEMWEYDFNSVPRRIENARNTINSLIQQRNQQLNLDIAESSHRMTEAALRDNATMKTIAILTMIFLPSTAVASFFSMSMFNWSAETGAQLPSKWLWVFFVIAIPLTILVLAGWYLWVKRYERNMVRFQDREMQAVIDQIDQDEETPHTRSGSVRLQTIKPPGKDADDFI